MYSSTSIFPHFFTAIFSQIPIKKTVNCTIIFVHLSVSGNLSLLCLLHKTTENSTSWKKELENQLTTSSVSSHCISISSFYAHTIRGRSNKNVECNIAWFYKAIRSNLSMLVEIAAGSYVCLTNWLGYTIFATHFNDLGSCRQGHPMAR